MLFRRKCRLGFVICSLVVITWNLVPNVSRKRPVLQDVTPKERDPLPILVWQKDEKNHPYFLSPVLQFEKDDFRRRSSFNLTGLDSVLSKTKSEEKLIIMVNWPKYYGIETRLKNGLPNCRVTSCKVSVDTELLPKADAVVFYAQAIKSHTQPPPKPANQMWVFFAHEAPFNFNFPKWINMFNWTMTYTFDSDVVAPYFVLLPKLQPDTRDFTHITKQKSASVMWLVSNCGARSRRDEYVKELQKYIKVDVYGRCGPFKCTRSGNHSCDNIQNNKYKFYLAFENSLCKGYLTEKVFRSYDLDIIPVVRGGVRYNEVLPHGTFINTGDFASPRLLAEHLNYLDKTDTAYAKILAMKSQFKISERYSAFDSSICDICVKVHDLDRFSNSYSDINKWWNSNTCFKASDF